jgi:hypothetical protein
MVEMVKVTSSSNIAEIGYHDSRLYVRFKDDGKRVYRYSGVPLIVWLAFRAVQSKGRFLQTQIIPYFLYQKISESDLVGVGTPGGKH